jgi:hypothetical protein
MNGGSVPIWEGGEASAGPQPQDNLEDIYTSGRKALELATVAATASETNPGFRVVLLIYK